MKMRNRFKFMKYNKKYACLFGEIIRIVVFKIYDFNND